ncbi:hypothetical protein BVC80_9075g38 [Macleaya cordata]|uniref:DUF7870 domain-containing protein n=1 Tax=Macleaya cordata TaxID=56857 RepID=A0A200PUC4_MACCD|nr:hypothetical protein BVC80_9075g38 [Macleaya cordata]
MELACGFRAKNQNRIKFLQFGPDRDKLVIKIPHSRVLRVFSRFLLLALAFFTFPWIFSINLSSSNAHKVVSHPINGSLLPMLFKDLINEGLLKSEGKGCFFSTGSSDEASLINLQNGNEMDLISESDFERQNSIPDNTFDFVLVSGFGHVVFMDRMLKTGGIAIVQLSDNPSNTFQKPSNYRIKYLRRFKPTFIAVRKTGPGELSTNSPTKRRLLGFHSEAKSAALKGLEDVLLEPPRKSLLNSYKFLKRTKFLPNLMDDSLDGYPRRVFIDVGSSDGSLWFKQNYPTRKRDFEMYKIETVSEEILSKAGNQQNGMSDWLMNNVREEEFVVMKAEAEVVEEILRNKAIFLVDELFLECKHQWQGGKNNKSRRAYWQCLALYGRLRDEGVVVHQWWG